MCYVVPMGGAIVTSFICGRKNSHKARWLNLMLWGGSLFGFIDHLWNKELFLISDNLGRDLLLGVVITLGIFAGWLVILGVAKLNPHLSQVKA